MELIDVPRKHLPPDFAERLVKSVRRRRHIHQLRIMALVAAIAVCGTGLVGSFCCHNEQEGPREPRLVAVPTTPTNDTQISGLMLFGFLRECFRRTRTGKKKEEDIKER
ncbi:MAG: hypothetical protein MJ240_07405 [Kiritimatiellae bacterium]|nr:hypothetical protein [Kiritimatiellia bacterium]